MSVFRVTQSGRSHLNATAVCHFPPRDMQVLHTSNFTQAKAYLLPARFFFLCVEEAWTSLISIRLQLATDAILCGALTLIVRDEQS